MALPNLGDHSKGATMTENQFDKYQTSNDLDSLLDDAMNGSQSVFLSISAGNRYFLDDEAYLGNFLLVLKAASGSPTLDGDFVLEVGTQKRHFGIKNDTGFSCIVEAGGSPTGSTLTVADGVTLFGHSDGENVRNAINTTYDLSFFAIGAIGFDELVGFFVANRGMVVPTTGSHTAYADTPSGSGESDLVFDIMKNATSHGTVTFASLDPVGVVNITTSLSLAAGERIKIVSPANPSPDIEATVLADVTITLEGQATS
jgi:hypothetical protein